MTNKQKNTFVVIAMAALGWYIGTQYDTEIHFNMKKRVK